MQEYYFVFYNTNNEYDNATLAIYNELIKQILYNGGIINCHYIENENIVDYLTLLPKILQRYYNFDNFDWAKLGSIHYILKNSYKIS